MIKKEMVEHLLTDLKYKTILFWIDKGIRSRYNKLERVLYC